MDLSVEEECQKVGVVPPPPPPSKTMLSYFTKLPSKAVVVEDTSRRKVAPAFNKQHVEKFQKTRLQLFDAELFNINNDDCNENKTVNGNQTNELHALMDVDPITNHISHEQSSPKFFVNYIKSIKSGQHKPFGVQRKPKGPLRAKLLQYHEDIRPPYFGTWQRKSKVITGRRPLALDEDVFDYEVDSEAEWDIGGPGESLKGDDSEDEEELDDYEIDMKTFVPHGYVSDDEIEIHSDQEETPSANQSVDEICDVEDSNASILIIGVKGPNGEMIDGKQNTSPQPEPQQQKQSARESSPLPQPVKPKQEIKPISLGIFYEDARLIALSESKIQFLKTFQGVRCKDC